MLSFTKFINKCFERMTNDCLSITAIKDQIQRGLNRNKIFEESDWLQRISVYYLHMHVLFYEFCTIFICIISLNEWIPGSPYSPFFADCTEWIHRFPSDKASPGFPSGGGGEVGMIKRGKEVACRGRIKETLSDGRFIGRTRWWIFRSYWRYSVMPGKLHYSVLLRAV